MPIVLAYAVSAALSWKQVWAQRRRPAFALASAACVVLVLGWAWSAVAVDFERFSQLLKPAA
jgi:hypothetical protein